MFVKNVNLFQYKTFCLVGDNGLAIGGVGVSL